ncbi:NucA/NucB deoxyribonuclease domain-containing protein [Streptomyces aureocirculatus]|uniref:NucA/NucB deoxyribonuclease domain-containing protein n=1 Tax=Streptomyces aureocirculatus TaxID=67275 RepID=UPI0004CB41A7|nr:hypothetical protein [Streptomyces aureocirculatus]
MATADDATVPQASAPRAGGQEQTRKGVLAEDIPGADEAETAPEEEGEQPPAGEVCSEVTEEDQATCLEPMSVDLEDLPQRINRSPRAGVDPPSWCPTEAKVVKRTRTKACMVRGWRYWTKKRINGRWVKTGETEMIFLSYSYGNSGIGRVAHQLEVYATKGWGDTLKATIDGVGAPRNSCVTESAKFPGQKLTLHKWMTGEAFFDTTATAAGAKGECGTGWDMKVKNAPYPPVDFPSRLNQFRCDNDTGGRPGVGCVVPTYASDMVYSKAKTPDLVSHVDRAQNSGLPKRLHRTEDQAVIDTNRRLACKDRPTVPNKSCDEYPIATSKEGLSAGGKRRTFDGCSYSDIPSGTGSKGASACAINEEDNHSQGGTHTQFFRKNRVLQDDPFDVKTGP